ncbi:MAG: TatD family hydrolase [Sarcina sp.]
MSKYKIFDSHAHYHSEQFDEDREALIEELKKENVVYIMDCGADIEGSKKAVELAKENEIFYAAVGIHPTEAFDVTDESIEKIRNLAKNEKVKAIGEIGLDYYWEENPSTSDQKIAFRRQMALAEELNLPVIIHDRDSHNDTLEVIKDFPNVKGVVHCFSGSAEMAKECVKRGYYIGITGVITFNNAKKIIKVCEEIDIEKILVETDAPYMAPVPMRGKRNQSNYIEYVIEKIAEIKNMEAEEVSRITIENAKKLFNIK